MYVPNSNKEKRLNQRVKHVLSSRRRQNCTGDRPVQEASEFSLYEHIAEYVARIVQVATGSVQVFASVNVSHNCLAQTLVVVVGGAYLDASDQ